MFKVNDKVLVVCGKHRWLGTVRKHIRKGYNGENYYDVLVDKIFEESSEFGVVIGDTMIVLDEFMSQNNHE
jgi:hypothetical protein